MSSLSRTGGVIFKFKMSTILFFLNEQGSVPSSFSGIQSTETVTPAPSLQFINKTFFFYNFFKRDNLSDKSTVVFNDGFSSDCCQHTFHFSRLQVTFSSWIGSGKATCSSSKSCLVSSLRPLLSCACLYLLYLFITNLSLFEPCSGFVLSRT